MEHVRLGRSGLQVSRLCLGTMTFGLQSDEATGVAVMDKAVEGGVDFFDTSDAYPLGGDLTTRGRTEEIIGRWLPGKRDQIILATKCFAPMGPSPMDGGNSRKHILTAVEGSLRRLGTDYIDLYQLHGYDQNTPIDETLSALDDLVHSGKVRYVGCSNFLTYQLVRAIGRSETLRLAEMRATSLSCTFGLVMAASDTRRSGSRTRSARSGAPPVCASRMRCPAFISPMVA